MSSEVPAIAGEAGVRRDQRFAVRLAAQVRGGSGTVPARLLDLSRGGALAEARCPPPAGMRVTLFRERLEVEARVVWVRGARFGLAYDRPISATELFFQLGRSRAAAEEGAAERPAIYPAAVTARLSRHRVRG